MALKVLGQVAPTIITNTTLYTCPADNEAVCSTLIGCNQNATEVTVRIAVRPGGASLAAVHYIAYNQIVPAYDSLVMTVGLSLAATDVVTVYASLGNTSWTMFGDETSTL
jgi:hypothetical protein